MLKTINVLIQLKNSSKAHKDHVDVQEVQGKRDQRVRSVLKLINCWGYLDVMKIAWC